MKMNKLTMEFGLDVKNKIEESHKRSIDGALAGLESFYYSFNNKDPDLLLRVWHDDEFVQLNNPLGGIVRGIGPISKIYEKIFNGVARIWVRFTDIVYYEAEDTVVFAGTEIGEFSTGTETIPLKIRTSRVFSYIPEKQSWLQVHHHGSIDNADLLRKYQMAVGNSSNQLPR